MKAELFFSQFHIPAVCVQLCFMLMLNSKQKLSQLSIMCAWVHTYSIWEWEYTVYMWNWRFVGGKKIQWWRNERHYNTNHYINSAIKSASRLCQRYNKRGEFYWQMCAFIDRVCVWSGSTEARLLVWSDHKAKRNMTMDWRQWDGHTPSYSAGRWVFYSYSRVHVTLV